MFKSVHIYTSVSVGIMVFNGVTCVVAHGCEHLIREGFIEGYFLWGTGSRDIVGVEILIYVIFRSSYNNKSLIS